MDGDVDMLDVSVVDMIPFNKSEADANVIKLWRELMETGELTSEHFKNFWRDTVPVTNIFQPNRE